MLLTFREGNRLVTFHITMTKCLLVGMAEQTKVLLAKPEELSSNPGTHTVEVVLQPAKDP